MDEAIFNDEMFEQTLDEYRAGKVLRKICEDNPDYPSYTTVWRWIHSQPERSSRFHAAQREHAAALMEDIITIADTDLDPKRARNRMFARNLVAGKYDRERFGDKTITAVEHSVNISLSLEQARARMVNVTPQPIVITQQYESSASGTTSDVEKAAADRSGIFS